MPQINRYSDVSTSSYNPMSLQEILLAPQAQRLRHDQTQQQLMQIQSELAKVDPLDVHLNEATKLRSDINNQVYKQAEELSKNGFNSNILNQVKNTNRNLVDLMSPTGRLGQINQAKQVYNANLKDYLEDATKNKGWSRERALINWQQNNQIPYTGYDDYGKIKNINQYGAPKKIETLDKLKQVKDLLGEQVVKEIGNSGYNLIPQQDGSVIMVDSSGRRIETSNRPNLQNALGLLQQQMNDTEWRSSMQFEGITPEAINNEITYGINSMIKTDVKDNRDTSASLHGYENGNKDKIEGTPTGITEDVTNIKDGAEDSRALERLYSGSGTNYLTPDLVPKQSTAPSLKDTNVFKKKFESTLTPVQQSRYFDTYNALKAQGKIDSNSSPYSSKVKDAVQKDWERTKGIATNNVIIVPDSQGNATLASPSLVKKDSNERNEWVNKRLNIALDLLPPKSDKLFNGE